MSRPLLIIVGTIILAAASVGAAVHLAKAEETMSNEQQIDTHPYLGMWVTGDGHIRQELLPSGRYDEARGSRSSAYQGRYEIRGDHIDYWDDTGFTADGTFVDADTLHHGGMIFHRKR
ncbi:Atu4866 domain-containing protein [Neorhizobium sp. NCHU2750]|uniref:Atu4866 domain-containing protein n=1 Tax=Neorhizobium sp. NCHU2750 TaxID=1825976 RepID=UPI000E735B96|nr:hypothetical protein NCHU2750_27690 [Neorhizobium sp. NCHU2750]